VDEVVDLEATVLACNTCNHEAPFIDFALERGVIEHIVAAPPGSFHRLLLCCPNCEAPGVIEGYFSGDGERPC
jgi:hypothetical protein